MPGAVTAPRRSRPSRRRPVAPSTVAMAAGLTRPVTVSRVGAVLRTGTPLRAATRRAKGCNPGASAGLKIRLKQVDLPIRQPLRRVADKAQPKQPLQPHNRPTRVGPRSRGGGTPLRFRAFCRSVRRDVVAARPTGSSPFSAGRGNSTLTPARSAPLLLSAAGRSRGLWPAGCTIVDAARPYVACTPQSGNSSSTPEPLLERFFLPFPSEAFMT